MVTQAQVLAKAQQEAARARIQKINEEAKAKGPIIVPSTGRYTIDSSGNVISGKGKSLIEYQLEQEAKAKKEAQDALASQVYAKNITSMSAEEARQLDTASRAADIKSAYEKGGAFLSPALQSKLLKDYEKLGGVVNVSSPITVKGRLEGSESLKKSEIILDKIRRGESPEGVVLGKKQSFEKKVLRNVPGVNLFFQFSKENRKDYDSQMLKVDKFLEKQEYKALASGKTFPSENYSLVESSRESLAQLGRGVITPIKTSEKVLGLGKIAAVGFGLGAVSSIPVAGPVVVNAVGSYFLVKTAGETALGMEDLQEQISQSSTSEKLGMAFDITANVGAGAAGFKFGYNVGKGMRSKADFKSHDLSAEEVLDLLRQELPPNLRGGSSPADYKLKFQKGRSTAIKQSKSAHAEVPESIVQQEFEISRPSGNELIELRGSRTSNGISVDTHIIGMTKHSQTTKTSLKIERTKLVDNLPKINADFEKGTINIIKRPPKIVEYDILTVTKPSGKSVTTVTKGKEILGKFEFKNTPSIQFMEQQKIFSSKESAKIISVDARTTQKTAITTLQKGRATNDLGVKVDASILTTTEKNLFAKMEKPAAKATRSFEYDLAKNKIVVRDQKVDLIPSNIIFSKNQMQLPPFKKIIKPGSETFISPGKVSTKQAVSYSRDIEITFSPESTAAKPKSKLFDVKFEGFGNQKNSYVDGFGRPTSAPGDQVIATINVPKTVQSIPNKIQSYKVKGLDKIFLPTQAKSTMTTKPITTKSSPTVIGYSVSSKESGLEGTPQSQNAIPRTKYSLNFNTKELKGLTTEHESLDMITPSVIQKQYLNITNKNVQTPQLNQKQELKTTNIQKTIPQSKITNTQKIDQRIVQKLTHQNIQKNYINSGPSYKFNLTTNTPIGPGYPFVPGGGLGFPKWKGDVIRSGSLRPGVSFKSRGTSYSPTIRAIFYGIRSKRKPSKITGLELRPIVT